MALVQTAPASHPLLEAHAAQLEALLHAAATQRARAPPPSPVPPALLTREACVYTSCFCEENAYKLVESLILSGRRPDHLHAVFISNVHDSVPVWQQRASNRPDGLVIWDYHVLVLEVPPDCPSAAIVWDLDTRLPFPIGLQEYAQAALQADAVELPSQYKRSFRVIPAPSFLAHFASDRSHMRRADGSWTAQPPPYPCIVAADGARNNLSAYRAMATDLWGHASPASSSSDSRGGSSSSSSSEDDDGGSGAGAACGPPGVQHHHHHGSHAPGDVEPCCGGWRQLLAAATASKYGVVVREPVLLGCLLGE